MKRTIIAITLVFLIASTGFAQRVSIALIGGYNIGSPPEVVATNYTSTTIETVKGTLGKGISFGLNLGVKFTEHVGADLAVSSLMGSTFESSDNSSTLSSSTGKISGKMIRIMPSLRVSGGGLLVVSPYAKVGLVLGISPKITEESTFTSGGVTNTYEYELTDGSSFGFTAAIGMGIKAGAAMKIIAEISGISQSYGPTKGNNTSRSDGLPLSEQVNYADSYSITDTHAAQRKFYSFSSIGVNIGLQIGFGM